jgi:hypothetical protein
MYFHKTWNNRFMKIRRKLIGGHDDEEAEA